MGGRLTGIGPKIVKQAVGHPKIEKGVPLPPAGGGRNGGQSMFANMTVGDSMFLVGRKADRVLNTASTYGHRHSPRWRFSVRTVVENGLAGVRVWRVE